MNLWTTDMVIRRKDNKEKDMGVEKLRTYPSHLFTIRVWQEEIAADESEWRGRIQIFPNGDVHYFREWNTLLPLLLTMLAESTDQQSPDKYIP